MGILNVTPDSFSDGGKFDSLEKAISRAEKMIGEGAAIIDVGGESTRPGADEVSVEEEIRRTVPVIRELSKMFSETCFSIDTSKPAVAEKAISAGARIINDVTGFRAAEMQRVAAKTDAGAVVMHMRGTPRTMQKAPVYRDVVAEVKEFFARRFEEMTKAGIAENAIVFDPGIGFGKTLEHNLELLRKIDQLSIEGRPILLGVSRKSFISKLIGSDDIGRRSAPTIGITAFAAEKGVPLHRVHEVKGNFESLRMTEAIKDSQ